MGSEPSDLIQSKALKKYLVPYSNSKNYKIALTTILNKEKPNLVHFQNDLEILEASQFRRIF